MSAKPDYVAKRFATQKHRSLEAALARKIAEEFPRIGGPRMQDLCARLILEVFEQHIRSVESVSHGQILWAAVGAKSPPANGKPIRDCHLVPVVLDLSNLEDVEALIARESRQVQLERRAVRLCEQAYAQGALLSNADLALLLNVQDGVVAKALCSWEEKHQKLVPRRATLHDLGSGLTHKRLICWKRYGEGKESQQIARETWHSIEAVDRYLGQYERVRCCREQGMSEELTAYTVGSSLGLVREYLEIDRLLKTKGEAK